jgi:hypothetical protein
MAIASFWGYDRAIREHGPGFSMGAESMRRLLISNLLGLVGAIIGGVLGFYTFQWLVGHGFYGLAIPGAFLGLGCGLLAQHSSILRGIVCGLAALVLSLYSETTVLLAPNDTFSYVIAHLTENPVTLLMIVIGTIIAFWVGKDGGYRRLSPSRAPAPAEKQKDPVEEV